MFTNLNLLLDSILSTIVEIFNLMKNSSLLNGVLAFWFLGIVCSIITIFCGGYVVISGKLESRKKAQAKKDAKAGPKSKPKKSTES